MRHVLRLALIFSFLAFPGRAAAQAVPDRSLHGTVLDTSRAPVAGALVVASPDGPGTRLTAVTDARGELTLSLGPGAYDITISAPRFVTYVQRLGATKTGSESREFVLQVEGPRETVDVSAGGGYQIPSISSATRTPTALRDVPQAVQSTTTDYRPADVITTRVRRPASAHQGENNRDQVIIAATAPRPTSSSAGVRDDDTNFINLDRVEALKGRARCLRAKWRRRIPRHQRGVFQPLRQFTFQAGS